MGENSKTGVMMRQAEAGKKQRRSVSY